MASASTDIRIINAIDRDDWDFLSQIFNEDRELMTKEISLSGDTPLIRAVTMKSHRCVKELVDRIVAVSGADNLFFTNHRGHNPFHAAAAAGNTTDAMILAEHNPRMLLAAGWEYKTPLMYAARYQFKDTLRYFLKVINDLVTGEEGTSPYTGSAGGDLINLIIEAGFLDVALEIVDQHPDIVLEDDTDGQTALQVLARMPELFPSTSKLGILGRLIYSLIPVKKSRGATQVNVFPSFFNKFALGFWSALRYLVPTIKNIHDIKVQHVQSNLLVKLICWIVIEKDNYAIAWNILGSALSEAVRHGTYDLAKECILTYPDIIYNTEKNGHLSFEAITQRQEQMYNLVCPTYHRKLILSTIIDCENGDNPLHKAAKLAPVHRLHALTGAALQMQHELLWFKEIERSVNASQKMARNRDGKTPIMVFVEEHKDLLKDGQQWMKDTSSSCSVVAALIVTIAFAAAFTIPGGNKDDGKPLLINKGSFILFIISDAIALFSSSTSVLIFLGILTRYAQEDFLYSLQNRMTIGLVSLFLSLTATLIAFSATLALVLEDEVTWIAAPLVIITSIPVGSFGWLQFPLLVELVYSRNGPRIFHPKDDQTE